jgi:ATP-dependent Lhr-like helicase
MERFFDEAQNTHLVIHSSFGARVNRAWGLALRKRFCRTFNFELQAAATEDALILSLGPTHSFELPLVGSFLKSASAESVLIQALLDAPMFEIRWRHNATRSLATPRFQSGKKVPATLVRIRANDLLATAFPDQQACLENLPGEREIPDHPLVWQTIQDCLTEAMDCGAFLEVLRRIEQGEIEVCYRDLTEPSPLAHEILNANPYAFLDPAPLEERRTQAVITRRFFDPKSARDLGQLDAEAIERVRREAWPTFENADELSDALYLCGFYVESELAARLAHTGTTPAQAAALFEQLLQQGRATRLLLPSGERLWACAERLAQLIATCPGAQPQPGLALPPALRASVPPEDAWRELMRARLESLGPLTLRALAAPLAEPGSDSAFRHAEQALLALETQGSAMIGRFTPGCPEPEWCVRGLLARIHRYTLERLRREIEPVTTAVFVRFLFDWQRVSPDQRQLGQSSLPAVLEQLEGFEASAGSWESSLLPARIADYDPAWLDGLCLSGQLLWGRAEPPANAKAPRSLATTPIVLAQRENWSWIIAARVPATEAPALELSAPGRQIEEQLQRGPRFFHDLRRSLSTSAELELALSELVAAGRISADSFSGMRGLLSNKQRQRSGRAARRAPAGLESAGRWSLLEPLEAPPEDGLERWARLLLRRYGVVFRALLDRENAPPWRDLLREYRRLEARGEVRGGRFVQRHAGEQFALPEAIPLLRSLRRAAPDGREVCVSACDPLNLLGTLLPGERVSATPSNFLLFRDGLAITALDGGKVQIFEEASEAAASSIGERLRQGPGAIEQPAAAPATERRARNAPSEARRPEAGLPASLLRLGSRRAS